MPGNPIKNTKIEDQNLMPEQLSKPANLTIQQPISQEDTYLSPVFMLKFGIRK